MRIINTICSQFRLTEYNSWSGSTEDTVIGKYRIRLYTRIIYIYILYTHCLRDLQTQTLLVVKKNCIRLCIFTTIFRM